MMRFWPMTASPIRAISAVGSMMVASCLNPSYNMWHSALRLDLRYRRNEVYSSMRKTAIAALIASLVLTLGAIAAEAPQVGQAAPDFALPSQDGHSISLKDFHGKWVVLYFYPKDMTQGCTIEAHNFQQDMPKYEKANAV